MFTVFIVLLGLQIAQASQHADSVVASSAIVTRDSGGRDVVDFTVTNRANIAVTAWEADIHVTFSDGSTRGWSLEREGYAEFENVRPSARHVIPPNATASARVRLGSVTSSISDVRVALRWAVFSDRSSIGDISSIQQLFSRRDREYRALAMLAGILRAAAKASNAREGLQGALAQLNAPDQEDPDHSAKRQMRINLRAAIDGDPTIRVPAQEFVNRWTAIIEARLKAADEHRQPKHR